MFRTRQSAPNHLLVFARVPELGRVKTRLASEIGPDRALVLYRAMLQDLLDAIGESDQTTTIDIVWTGSSEVSGALLRELFSRYETSTQAGRDLGERLQLAFYERIGFLGAQKVIAIGTDDPTVTRAVVDNAFALLDSCDWVIGPASDGGYYLIGCRGGSFDVRVFQEISWGTGAVLSETLHRLKELGATVALLPARSDLDVVDDVRQFSSEAASNALRTRQVLRDWGWVA